MDINFRFSKLFYGKVQFFYFAIVLMFFTGCQKSDDIIKYHSLVNDAEKLIVCKDFQSANDLFAKSWKFNKNPFAMDIYNRMQAALYSNDSESAFICAKRLVKEKGLALNIFKEKYQGLKLYPKQWELFMNWYEIGYKEFEKNHDKKMRDLCLRIQFDDQKYRKTEDRYTKFKSLNNEMDSLNLKKLQDLIKEYGYPKEEKIGLYKTENSTINGFQDILEIPILHAFQQMNQSWSKDSIQNLFELDKLLKEELEKGNLHPDQYSLFKYGEFQHKNKIGINNHWEPPISIINDNFYMKEIPYQQLDNINKERKELLLAPLEEFYSKSFFMMNNTHLNFQLTKQGMGITYHLANPDQEIFTAQMFGLVEIDSSITFIKCD